MTQAIGLISLSGMPLIQDIRTHITDMVDTTRLTEDEITMIYRLS